MIVISSVVVLICEFYPMYITRFIIAVIVNAIYGVIFMRFISDIF